MLFGGETAESYYDEGLTSLSRGNVEQAATYFRKALELDAGLGGAWHQLGRCYYRLGRAAEAIDAFRRAQELNVRHTPLDLGYALLLQGAVDRAAACFSQMLEVESVRPRAMVGLARCALKNGQFDHAFEMASQAAVALRADQLEAEWVAGQAAARIKLRDAARERLERADRQIDKLIEVAGDRPDAYFLRGMIYYFLEEYLKALESGFQPAEQRCRPDVHYCVAHEHFALVDILAWQGWCWRALDHGEKARELGRRILKLKPDSQRGRVLAGDSSAEGGRLDPGR
ncbi:MAG TPA: tetratricopeptide repeat protein [Candidatus Hydrogenedentes bacterium]|nr:tetratricopeptide repeat protein [Candidatus Hydrogenedentota bacterium]